MSKLFKVKECLNIPEAANYISQEIGEVVSEADIYEFALNRHLVISVYFESTLRGLKVKKFIRLEEIVKENFDKNDGGDSNKVKSLIEENLLKGCGLLLEEKLKIVVFEMGGFSLQGIYDIPMLGGDIIAIETKLKIASGYPDKGLDERLDFFTYVKDQSGEIYCLLKRDKEGYSTADRLPENSQIVIRTSELKKIVKILNDEEVVNRLLPKEILEREEKKGKANAEIAAAIDTEWSGADKLTNKELGRLFAKNKYVSDAAHEQRGRRLRGKKT